MIKYVILVSLVVFFAFNMGASGVAPSFASAYGGNVIKRRYAYLLFGIFVMIGAVTLGHGVTMTLGKNMLPREVLDLNTVLAILGAATIGLFLANILKIPQSTSQVTVGAIVGAGIYYNRLNVDMVVFRILPMWVILPMLAYFITWLIYRMIYPPERDNLHIYQRLVANEDKLRILSLVSSCYVAFAIGANNVGNAAGPLFGAGIIGAGMGLVLVSPLFGIGSVLLGRGNLETVGKDIVPIGIFSGALVSFVTATLLIVASILGIPQSLVQLNVLSIFAVSCVKNGHRCAIGKQVTRKTALVWAVTPLLSIVLSYILLIIINKGFPK